MKGEFKLICAGFGGQGILSLGKFVASAAMNAGLHITWLPSYGPEMRGGTANCSVVLSGEEIGSPIIVQGNCAIVMNRPSLGKFEPSVEKGGALIINSSLIPQKTSRGDICAYYVPANALAEQSGTARNANIVMLGAFAKLFGNSCGGADAVRSVLQKAFGGGENIQKVLSAFELGFGAV